MEKRYISSKTRLKYVLSGLFSFILLSFVILHRFWGYKTVFWFWRAVRLCLLYKSFTDSLNMIRRRHLDTVPLMAQAVFKMNNINHSDGVSDTVQYFLDRLYTNRISIHMLVSHYNALLGSPTTVTGMVGTIDQRCDILGVCQDAYMTAATMCDREYMDHPELVATALDPSDENVKTQDVVSASYVPSHLHHIMFEILKVNIDV